MKYLVSSILLLFNFTILSSQEINGTWKGDLEVQGTKLPLVFNIKQNENKLVSTMDSPMQGAKDIPVTTTTFEKNELVLSIPTMQLHYKGVLKGDKIEGTFSQGQMSLPFTLSRKKEGEVVLKRPQTPQPPFNYNVEEVTFINPVDKNTLAGTLTTPVTKKDFPVVVLISGSGQQNRNCELFGHQSFWVIADDFAKKGIGVLRIDDRGTGGSDGLTNNVTTQDFARDTNAAVAFLVQKGFKTIGLIGHSEGGIIAPMVASENTKVKFIIAMAGPGIASDELLLMQTNAIGKAAGASDEKLKMGMAMNRKLYSLIKNYTGTALKSDVKKEIIEAMQKMPQEHGMGALEIEKIAEQESSKVAIPWFSYFLKINPAAYWSKLKIPVLALNGDKDLQVAAKANLTGIKSALDKGANKQFEIVEFPNLNHLFQEAKTGSVEEYAQIEQTIAPQVLDKMSSWILKR